MACAAFLVLEFCCLWSAAVRHPHQQTNACLHRAGLQVFPEGFVIRLARGFPASEFELATGKYVRAGHLQTKDDFRRNWQPSIDKPRGALWC